jgi:acetoin utilization deacetylase AcuC-like enzyme
MTPSEIYSVFSGYGYTLNFDVPAGAGPLEYSQVFDHLVIPVLEEFAPEATILQCGFDAADHGAASGEKFVGPGMDTKLIPEW